ncbi:MAG: hypothetical protein KF704_06000 [Crocinitomicaceae bacterium]|nr:hypothetical protein [Crocinitomicaceae bacterium]
METIILPFHLGMEYENWEFDLEPINDRIKGSLSYLYTKDISIFGVKPRNIELIFYWEILSAIILEFEKSDLPKVEKLSLMRYSRVNRYFYKTEDKINIRIYYSLLC